ncbi:MAG: tRNA (adenosine(37)-N6)-threonylcarbamoyltransferase complex dimerization subunit type 1 TsaB [Treponema sp.]|nr:tRNA (adenosine(37)-N6)-threonylcarbamoyltransferase complex dimerization subunit type 1 TsaB [Treponema sp.]
MKALAIDCACSRMTVAAKNEDYTFTAIYDIGMRQSETLVPAIDEVLQKCGLAKNELDYTALTVGPGSFTGLRLGISALKAIECAFGTPIYGISSIEAYAYPFIDSPVPTLACIDANKDKFYAGIYHSGKIVLEDGDYEVPFIIERLKNIGELNIAGFEKDMNKLISLLEFQGCKPVIHKLAVPPVTTDCLFALAEKKITAKLPPLKDFDGPVYLRASEAEIKLSTS